MKKIIALITLAIIIGAGIAGWQWYGDRIKNQGSRVKSYIDRMIPEEHRVRIEAEIASIQEKIGGDRDIKDLNLWIDLGNTYGILGRLAEARDAYRVAVELNSLNYIAWGNLGDVLTEMGDLTNAESSYRKAIELVDQPVYYEKYAAFLEQHFPEKKKNYENLLLTAVQTTGQRPEFIARLAVFYEAEGRLAEAKSHLELLIQLNPELEAARDDLRRVEQKLAEQQRQ